MKDDTRCVDGRLFRHDPQPDDPDLETDIGRCPECEGQGCEVVAVGNAMQQAWDEICSDTGCHPTDIEHQGRKLFFHPAHWARLVAKYLSNKPEPKWRCTHCGLVLDLRWKAEFESL